MTAQTIETLYQNRFPSEELARKNEIWQMIVKHFLQQFIKPDDTVIDPACGYGEFINNVCAKRKVAFDLNSDSRKFLARDVEFIQGNAIELLQKCTHVADVVFVSNFLEHLPDKQALEAFFSAVQGSLKDGGKFLILGPNLRYLPGAYWDFYDHHLGLTHLSLQEALELHNFRVERCIDKFLPYTTKGKLPTHPLLVHAYLKAPWLWRMMGKQFFLVAAMS